MGEIARIDALDRHQVLPNSNVWVDLGTVGHRLNHLAPDFDPRTYDCSKLVTVVEKSGKFLVERPPGGGVRIKRR